MKKYRSAVLGLGLIGAEHVDTLLRIPQAEIAYVCDSREELARDFASRIGAEPCTDWHSILSDPSVDVVHDCLPVSLHDEVNLAVLSANKHLYCEKPLSLTLEGGKAVASLAKSRSLKAAVNHQYRMNAAVQEMRERVRLGLPGRILSVTGHYLQESGTRETDWSSRMENTGISRALADIGTHWADTACHVLGMPIVSVLADLHIHHPVRYSSGESHVMDTEDTAFVLLRFADGTPGQVTISKSCCGHLNDQMLSLWGTEYGMTWQQEIPDRLLLYHRGMGPATFMMNRTTCQPAVRPFVTLPAGHMMGWSDALRNAMQSFYDSLDSDRPSFHATLEEGCERLAFVEACVRSSHTHRFEEVLT